MEFQASSSTGCNTNDIEQIISVSQKIGCLCTCANCSLLKIFNMGQLQLIVLIQFCFSCGTSLSWDCLCRFDMDLDLHSTLSSTLVWWTFNCDYLLDFEFYLLVLTGAPFAPFMTRSCSCGQRFDTHCYNLAAPVVTNTTSWYEEVVLCWSWLTHL